MGRTKAISDRIGNIPVKLRQGAEEAASRISNADTNQLISLNACGCNNVVGCAPCAASLAVKGVALGIQALSLVGKGPHRGGEKTVK